MPNPTITCYCGSCSLTLADGEATCFFQCGCNSCRQKIQFGQANGGRECSPLPKLVYLPSFIDAVDGQHLMQAFKLREGAGSTQVYCTSCWAIIGVDHVGYPDNIFMNFPEFCINNGDFSVPLAAYINMLDYGDDIGPEPLEDVPLFESVRYKQERERLFRIPDTKRTFTAPDDPVQGYTFRSLLAEIGAPTTLNLEEGVDVLATVKDWLQERSDSPI